MDNDLLLSGLRLSVNLNFVATLRHVTIFFFFFFDTEKGTGLVSGDRNDAKVKLRAFFPL